MASAWDKVAEYEFERITNQDGETVDLKLGQRSTKLMSMPTVTSTPVKYPWNWSQQMTS